MINSSTNPVRFGMAGLGGFAWVVAQVIARRRDVARLVASCDPDPAYRAERLPNFREWGAKIFDRFEPVLGEPIEAVWLPLPIALHLPFMQQALNRGKHVLCEKPAASTVQEVDAMIAARDAAGIPVFLGYQHLADPAILQLKRRLVAGELGEIRHARTVGCWPRGQSYFRRNGWAGRLKVKDTWVLDSPLANAMSHHLQLAMFLMGTEVTASAEPASVEAELYRVNPIENFDTCSVRVHMQNESDLLVLFTHASQTNVDPTIEIIGSRGRVIVRPENQIEWYGPEGAEVIALSANPRDCLLEEFCRSVRGEPAVGVLATLEIARAPVVVVNQVSECAIPRDVPFSVLHPDDDPLRYVPGIESIFERCAASGQMIHESGLAPWSVSACHCSTRGYTHFSGVAAALARTAS